MQDDEIRRRLTEDVGTDEVEELLPLVHSLQQWQPPPPAAGEAERLAAGLQAMLPPAPWWRRGLQQWAGWWPWQLLRTQARVVRAEIWAASVLVIALGLLVSLTMTGAGAAAAQPLVLLAPVVAAAGISFLYSPADELVREVELVTAVSLRLLLLTRLLLVFAFNLLLGAGASLLLAFALPNISWWTLITLWLAPMTFLSALAFLLTVLSSKPDLAMLVSLGVWALQIARLSGGAGLWLAWLPDLTAAATQPGLLVLSLLLFAVAMWAGGQEERWV